MSLLPKKDRIKANVKGARQQAGRARSVARMIDDGFSQSVRNVGEDAELIYQSVAPRRSGRLARGIRAIPTGDSVVVTASAVDPRSGFDYVAVSRFGHRKRIIVPVTKSGRPRKARPTGLADGRFTKRRHGALMFTSRGQSWILASVRGFRPRGDWVDRARPYIEKAAETELEQTGNEIAVRWSS